MRLPSILAFLILALFSFGCQGLRMTEDYKDDIKIAAIEAGAINVAAPYTWPITAPMGGVILAGATMKNITWDREEFLRESERIGIRERLNWTPEEKEAHRNDVWNENTRTWEKKKYLLDYL